MTTPADGYRCPRCSSKTVFSVGATGSFSCPACRTAVVLVDGRYCFHATLDGTEAPIRSAIQRIQMGRDVL